MQDAEQKTDLERICKGFDNYKNLDYIACWFILGAKYANSTKTKYAFVTTNSICQGDSVALLWRYIFDKQLEIFFAYQSFKWANNAKYNAGVTCAIIGITDKSNPSIKKIFNNNIIHIANNINAYLLDAPNIIIGRLNGSISGLPEMVFGNKPSDGGHLILSQTEGEDLLFKYPEAKSIVKFYQGADSFINGETRYCLWIPDELVHFAKSIPEISQRLENVAAFRLASKADSTVLYADRPHLFKQRAHKDGESLIIPRVSSERREYIPIGFLDNRTIVSDAAQVIYNTNIFIFGIITSKMHMAWVKTIGGRLKTDYRYSNLCYNSFPFPKISEQQRKELEECAEEVILVREEFTELTLAQMYDPDKMPQLLRDAHRALDLAVERCYRPEPFTSDEERLEHLFKLYEKMTKTK